MKAVGIKILKNNLSRYLDMVREGEIVYVTDRDEIIAEIHKPISAPGGTISRWEAFLNEQERKGSIIRAKRKDIDIAAQAKKLKAIPNGPSLQDLLNETRADRF